MRKFLFSLLVSALILVPMFGALPVEAKDPQYIGSIKRLDKYTETKLIENIYDGEGKLIAKRYEATISSLPMTTDDGKIIDPTWERTTDETGQVVYLSGHNNFIARVTEDGRVSVEDGNGKLSIWDPALDVDGIRKASKPKILNKDPYNENYKNNVLEWTYTFEVSSGFVGLGKTSVAIKRQLRIIEGSIQEYWIIYGDPKYDFIIKQNRLFEQGSDGRLSEARSGDSSTHSVSVDVRQYNDSFVIYRDAFKNKTYPVIIDPVMTFTTSSYDGDLASSSTTWSSAHDAASAYEQDVAWTWCCLTGVNWYTADLISVIRGYVYFDTSSLSTDDTITSAKLQLYSNYLANEGGSFSIQIQSGMPTYPHSPRTLSDFNLSYYSGDGGSISSASIGSGYNNISLTASGLSWINKNGVTKFCLRSSDDLNNTAPTADKWWAFYTYEQGTGYAPKLVVTYTVPIVPPSVYTYNAYDMGETQASFKGEIVDYGGEVCTVKFNYGTTISYGYNTPPLAGYETNDIFVDTAYGLSRGTYYHVRAQAQNSAGLGYGLDKTFLTKPDEPTGFTATSGDVSNALSWTKGTGANKTLVRFKTTGYPSSITDGTQIYFDTGTNYNHTTLTAGTTYYYSAWSEITTSGLQQYSPSYVTSYATPYYLGAPDVETNAATSVTVDSMVLHGYLIDSNQASGTVTLYLCWDTTGHSAADGYSYSTNVTYGTMGWDSVGPFSVLIDTLAADTNHYFRAKAVGTNGTGYGIEIVQKTGDNSAPQMLTNNATGFGINFATLNGKVVDYGGLSVTAWFNWGLSPDNMSNNTTSASGLITNDEFYYPLSGLNANTTYYYRAVGENTKGIHSANITSFSTTAPAVPEAQTKEAISIGATEMTLQGVLVSDGGMSCEVQFEWDLNSGAPYAYSTGWQPGYSSGLPFSALVSSLNVTDTVYFIAQAKNISGTDSGDEKYATTVFAAPEDLSAKSIGANTISLSWTRKGDQTHIRYKTTGYPVDRLDGTVAYSGPADSATHDGLVAGTTYFYRAWSWRAPDTWSGTYVEDAATTWAIRSTTEEETYTYLEDPGTPERMYAEPYEEKLQNLPGYDEVNAAADAMNIPRGHFWMFMAFSICVGFGLLMYVPTQSIIISTLAIGIAMLGFSLMGVFPMWMIIIYAILGLGIYLMFGRAGA